MPWTFRSTILCNPQVHTPLINVNRANLDVVVVRRNATGNDVRRWGTLRHLQLLGNDLGTIVNQAKSLNCWYRAERFSLSNSLVNGQVVIWVPKSFGASFSVDVFEFVP